MRELGGKSILWQRAQCTMHSSCVPMLLLQPNAMTMVTLQYYTCSKRGPNITAIANQGMLAGTGRKGGVPKRRRNRKSTPIETRSVHSCLQISTENNWKLDTSNSSFLLGSPSHSQTTLAQPSHNVTCDSHQSPYVAPNPEHASLQNSASLLHLAQNNVNHPVV